MTSFNGPQDRSVHSASAVRVLSVPAGPPVVVRFLDKLSGLLTHHNGKKPFDCKGEGKCPAGLHRLRLIYKGYSPVELWDPAQQLWIPTVLEVTEHLEEMLRARSLRGEVWLLSRGENAKPNSPVKGLFCERQLSAKVSKPFDMLPVLLRLYHTDSLLLGASNPLPPKVMLQPVQGEAPNLPEEILPQEEAKATPEELAWFREQMKQAMGSMKGGGVNGHTAAGDRKNGHASNGKAEKPR